MIEYVARFTELARFADNYVATDLAKVRRFENGLRLSIRGKIVGLRLQDMDSMIGTAMTIEREMEDAQNTRDVGVSGKRKEGQSSSSSGKKQRASSSWGVSEPRPSRPGTYQGCQSGWADSVLPLPVARKYEEGLPPELRIPGFRDSAIPISYGTGADTVYSSTP